WMFPWLADRAKALMPCTGSERVGQLDAPIVHADVARKASAKSGLAVRQVIERPQHAPMLVDVVAERAAGIEQPVAAECVVSRIADQRAIVIGATEKALREEAAPDREAPQGTATDRVAAVRKIDHYAD